MSRKLPRNPEDLSAAWAQAVINRQRTGIRVGKVEIISVDVGTTTRLLLLVEHDGPANLPRRWFVKLPSLDWRARWITALPRLLPTEVRFYREIMPQLAVAMPQCLFAQSSLLQGSLLVLADVTESGAVPGRPGDALSYQQAKAVTEQLAGLHARFWNRPQAIQAWPWLAGNVRRLEDMLGSALAVPLMRRGLRLAGSIIPAELRNHALRYARHRRQAMRYLADAPQTLVHHDCHAGNLFWQQDACTPGFLDWQLVRWGEGIGDIAYLLATALDVDTRRQHETALLECYARALQDDGVPELDRETLRLRYRAHLAYAFEAMVVTLAVGGMMEPHSNLELIRRAAAAVLDADAFSALPIQR